MVIEGGQWKVKAQYNMMTDGHDLVIIRKGFQGEEDYYSLKLLGERSPCTMLDDEAILQTDRGFLQAFMDCAWEQGIRPIGYQNVHEAMKATEAHISDLRHVAFALLPAPKQKD